MKIHTLPELLAEIPFFEGMADDDLAFIAGCATNVHLDAGTFLLHVGEPAQEFFVLRSGRVALELEAANKINVVQTVGPGQLVGWSWLVPPYTWHYDARAGTPVSAIRFDAVCVRNKCETDPAFGFRILQRLSRLIVERLMATRMQLADVYE